MQLEDILTTTNIGFTLMVLGVLFSIYRSYHKPQEDIEVKLAVGNEQDKNKATVLAQKEMENKAALLDQQVKLVSDQNEKKFVDFGKRLDDSFLMASNHIHTVDVKVDNLTVEVNGLRNEIVKLSTIVEERMPRKVV